MIGALNNAVTGLNLASARAEKAADTIVHAGAAASGTVASAQGSGNASLAGPVSGSPAQAVPPVETGLEQGIVELKLADISYKASAAVIKTVNSSQDQLLDVLR